MFAAGAVHNFVFAIDASGHAPAAAALKLVKEGMWDEDPEAVEEGLPSDAQISSFNKIYSDLRYFAKHGVPPKRANIVNKLRHGIWEYKEVEKRFSFYDSDGRGGYIERDWHSTREESDHPDAYWWDLPTFAREIRLGHCFGKPLAQRKTPEDDIEHTCRIREEDLAHDRVA